MEFVLSLLICIAAIALILFSTCYNRMDKWRFRADRQYPYVREALEEWETVTRRLLKHSGREAPDDRVAGQKHIWEAVSSVNRLAEACPAPDPADPVTAPLFGRQGELEEELELFRSVYNGVAASYNRASSRPVVRTVARLLKWGLWEELCFTPES